MTSGYSLRRNNTCHAGASELNCGETWGTMHRCCPFGTNCGKNDCRTTNEAPEEKQCANSTWSLYYAEDFFCCDVDQMAFMWYKGGKKGWVGCANKGFVLEESQTSLAAIVEGSATTTSATATQSASLSTTTLSSPTTQSAGAVTSAPSDSQSSSSSETNTGAIAGGVVGGVAGVVIIGILVWLIMRRRARAVQNTGSTVPTTEFYASKGPPVAELNNERGLELDGQPNRPPLHELPAQ